MRAKKQTKKLSLPIPRVAFYQQKPFAELSKLTAEKKLNKPLFSLGDLRASAVSFFGLPQKCLRRRFGSLFHHRLRHRLILTRQHIGQLLIQPVQPRIQETPDRQPQHTEAENQIH